jgi:hypothetical protein
MSLTFSSLRKKKMVIIKMKDRTEPLKITEKSEMAHKIRKQI